MVPRRPNDSRPIPGKDPASGSNGVRLILAGRTAWVRLSEGFDDPTAGSRLVHSSAYRGDSRGDRPGRPGRLDGKLPDGLERTSQVVCTMAAASRAGVTQLAECLLP